MRRYEMKTQSNTIHIMKLFIFSVLTAVATAAPAEDHAFIAFPDGLPRVVGGIIAKPHQFPWQISLQYCGDHHCGGSILNAKWVLSAGHCVSSTDGYEVVAGKHDLSKKEPTEQRSKIKRAIIHESYMEGVGPYDIAVIELAVPFKLNYAVLPVKLPTKEEEHSGLVTLSGWGSTSSGDFPDYPDLLQTVDKPIVPYDVCERAWGGPGASPLDKLNLCTGPLTGGIAACSGDSGGPLVQYKGREAILLGIVSWGHIPCGAVNKPTVYTRVSAFLDWIKDNTR